MSNLAEYGTLYRKGRKYFLELHISIPDRSFSLKVHEPTVIRREVEITKEEYNSLKEHFREEVVIKKSKSTIKVEALTLN